MKVLEHLHNGKWWAISNISDQALNTILFFAVGLSYENGYTYFQLPKLFESEPYFRTKTI